MRPFLEDYPGGHNRGAYAPLFPDYVEDVVLPADTVVRLAIPADARFFQVSLSDDARLKLGTIATSFTLPSATTSNGSGSVFGPGDYRIPPALGDGTTVPTHLVFRAPRACTGSVVFYQEK